MAKTKPISHANTQPANGDLIPISEGPALAFVALDAIEARPQLRTVFDAASLAELADDIKARGLLQPVLLRPGQAAGRFVIIAGERRIRAARLAGLAAVPAIVGPADDETATDMQLAENIQRQDLDLAELARAVRILYDRLGTLDKVAQRVKKSKAWVSKHLALSCEGFAYEARQLLTDGISEDLELLTTLSRLSELSWQQGDALTKAIRAGTANRATARNMLKQAKIDADTDKKRQAKQQEQLNRERQQRIDDARNQPDTVRPSWTLKRALQSLDTACLYQDTVDPVAIFDSYTEEQRAEIDEHLKGFHTQGTEAAAFTVLAHLANYENEHFYVEVMACALGMTGQAWTIYAFLTALKVANRSAAEADESTAPAQNG